eukprot:366391-Chlamydomonas_euryale.AAC.33
MVGLFDAKTGKRRWLSHREFLEVCNEQNVVLLFLGGQLLGGVQGHSEWAGLQLDPLGDACSVARALVVRGQLTVDKPFDCGVALRTAYRARRGVDQGMSDCMPQIILLLGGWRLCLVCASFPAFASSPRASQDAT